MLNIYNRINSPFAKATGLVLTKLLVLTACSTIGTPKAPTNQPVVPQLPAIPPKAQVWTQVACEYQAQDRSTFWVPQSAGGQYEQLTASPQSLCATELTTSDTGVNVSKNPRRWYTGKATGKACITTISNDDGSIQVGSELEEFAAVDQRPAFCIGD